MSEEENLDMEENLDKEDNEDFQEDRAELEKMGVKSTFELLSKPGNHKKPEEKKVEFRGFK